MARCLSDAIKRASLDASEAGKPCDLRFGTVVSVTPLKVKITDTFTLPESLLIVPQHLTDYTVPVVTDWTTSNSSGGSGESSFSLHNHKIDGTKTMTICNALKVNDQVALIRQHGGRSYLIIDRI